MPVRTLHGISHSKNCRRNDSACCAAVAASRCVYGLTREHIGHLNERQRNALCKWREQKSKPPRAFDPSSGGNLTLFHENNARTFVSGRVQTGGGERMQKVHVRTLD